MSATPQAVFISYAREDLAAARRIADALGAFEVEVWFDQDGLEGGDAWDQKIRRQIRECALFVAVISASTEGRREAYFRLEWKLAEERTHLMAEGTSFLLPIAIDGTPEATALVPDSFRRAQWMRLPRGVPNTQFVDRVRGLLENQQYPPSPRADGAAADSRPSRPGKKWALIAAVVALSVAASIPFWSTRDAVPPAPGSAPAVIADKSIAVLPFANMSDDKDSNAFFADGIQEDILTSLSNIRELRVVSRTSVMEYRGTTKKIGQIARELGVAYILEGSVRRAGNTVRVTGQLIKAGTDEHVWAKAYNRDLSDIFAIQAALAEEIVGSLNAVLSTGEKNRLERRPTTNLVAYELLLKAREIGSGFLALRVEEQKQRVSLTEQALKLDPDLVEGWINLSAYHGGDYFSHADLSAENLAKARHATEQALRLAPDDPAVLVAEGVYYLNCFRDYAKARQKLEAVQRQWPNRADVYLQLGNVASRDGRWAEVVKYSSQAAALEPRSYFYLGALYNVLMHVRRYEEALSIAQRMQELRPDELSASYRVAETAFRATGDSKKVDAWFAQVPPARRTEREFLVAGLTWAARSGDAAAFLHWRREMRTDNARAPTPSLDVAALVASGNRAQAQDVAAQGLKIKEEAIRQQPTSRFWWGEQAKLLAFLGRNEEALVSANRAVVLMPLSLDARYGVFHAFDRAEILAAVGRNDEALTETARLLQLPSELNVHVIRRSLEWKALQSDSRLEAILNDPKNNAPLF